MVAGSRSTRSESTTGSVGHRSWGWLRGWIVAMVAVIVTGCAKSTSPTAADGPAEGLLPIVEHTLSNGMRVLLSPNPGTGRISARIVVRAGSADEPRDATGLAHYLEHLLANKGTQRLGTTNWEAEKPHLNEVRALYDELFETSDEEARATVYARIAASAAQANQYAVQNELKQLWGVLGGRGFNAFTNRDITAYVVDLPANRLEHWAKIESDRFRSPVFRSFQTEVETVYEEKNRSLDNPARAMWQTMSESVYANTPYAVSTLGTIEHLKNPSVSKTEAFFRTWYVPSNMGVVLAGDFDLAKVIPLLESELGTLPRGEAPPRPTIALTPIKGEQRVNYVHQGAPELVIAWPTVPFGHPDDHALVMASQILSNGATGIMDRTLVQPKKVRLATAGSSQQARVGLFRLLARPRPGQSFDELVTLLDRSLEDLRQGKFSDEDLEAVVRNARIRDKRDSESNAQRAQLMTYAIEYDLSVEETLGYTDDLAAVTRDDVLRVVQDYLGDDRIQIRKSVGKPDIPTITAPKLPPVQLNTGAHSAFYEQIAALPASPLAPQSLEQDRDYAMVDTAAGRLYVTPNPYSDLFSVTWRWERGKVNDPGLCQAWALFDASGAGDDDLAAFERWRFEHGVSIETSCNDYTSTLTLAGEEEQFDAALGRLVERIAAPQVANGRLARIVSNTIQSRADAKTQSNTMGSALGAFALRGPRSPFLEGVLTDEALRSLTESELQARIASLWGSKGTITYLGIRPVDEAAAALAPASRSFTELPPRPRFRVKRWPESQVLFLDVEAVQSYVRLYVPGERLDRNQIPQLLWLRQMLGGSSGIVFQEVRESRGLAYSAYGTYREPREPGDDGLLMGSLATQADKTATATQLLTSLLRPVAPDAARYDQGRASAIEALRTQRIPFRRIGSQAAAWHRQGFDGDPRAEQLAALEAFTPEDLAPLIEALQEQTFVLAVAGDRDRIDLEALEAIAPIVPLTLDELIAY